MIRLERSGAVARVVLNRAEKRNALSRALLARLQDAFAQANVDPEVGAVVICAAGPAFCAGLDLDEVGAELAACGVVNCADFSALLQTIADAPAFTLACVEGPATAGGVGLLCACDAVWMSADATLALPGLARGLHAEVLVPWLGRAIGHRRATECLVTGGPWSAAEAVGFGLASRVFPAAAEIHAAIDRLAALPAAALRAHKALVRLHGAGGAPSGGFARICQISPHSA